MTDEAFDPDKDRGEAIVDQEPVKPRFLGPLIMDAIVHADCYCKPGDPTCRDWINAHQRWSAIHKSVIDSLTRRDFPGAPHGSVLEQVHRVFTAYQGDIDPWMIAAELVAFVDKHSILKYTESKFVGTVIDLDAWIPGDDIDNDVLVLAELRHYREKSSKEGNETT
jgi:hypothetical protein